MSVVRFDADHHPFDPLMFDRPSASLGYRPGDDDLLIDDFSGPRGPIDDDPYDDLRLYGQRTTTDPLNGGLSSGSGLNYYGGYGTR